MILKSDLKALIRFQKIIARKSIASVSVKVSHTKTQKQYSMFKMIADERKFLASDFSGVKSLSDLMKIIHDAKHNPISKNNDFLTCRHCKKIVAEMAIELPGAPAEFEADQEDKEDRIKPRMGNLMTILEKEVQDEVANMERRRVPSQNDLTRWALKEAVLRWYKNKNLPVDTIIVDNMYDDRLKTDLAPDFSEIYQMWWAKLDELQRLDNKYTLNMDEFDKAEEDIQDGMRGSAFEKQLDRYREEFMKKLYAII